MGIDQNLKPLNVNGQFPLQFVGAIEYLFEAALQCVNVTPERRTVIFSSLLKEIHQYAKLGDTQAKVDNFTLKLQVQRRGFIQAKRDSLDAPTYCPYAIADIRYKQRPFGVSGWLLAQHTTHPNSQRHFYPNSVEYSGICFQPLAALLCAFSDALQMCFTGVPRSSYTNSPSANASNPIGSVTCACEDLIIPECREKKPCDCSSKQNSHESYCKQVTGGNRLFGNDTLHPFLHRAPLGVRSIAGILA